MKDDKKKLLIIGLLALIVIAVGAFQLIGKRGSQPVATTATPKKSLVALDAKANVDKVNPFSNTSLPARDPFQAVQLAPSDPNKPATGTIPPPQPIRQPRVEGPRLTGVLPEAADPRNVSIAPLKVPDPIFAYQLVGVIEGPRPAAVFQDSTGGQRLVQAGSSVDGDCRVLSIQNGEVRVQFKDKTLRLKPGGNPSGK